MEKVVLAYSGGLDTSVILKWLIKEHRFDVFVFIANVGQPDDFEEVVQRAISLGVVREKIFLCDIRDEFINDFYCSASKANAIYETYYLMGTPIARPAIAKKQVEIAHQVGAKYVAHGCTQKGNDQLRFELAYAAIDPSLKIIAPWRTWGFKGRKDLVSYATENGIGWIQNSGYSRDENLIHTTAEGLELEDPACSPMPEAWKRTKCPTKSPDEITEIVLGFIKGVPNYLNGEKMTPREILEELNKLGAINGIGRLDLVDNRVTGLKSRGLFESPGASIWHRAHRALESITLTREQMHLANKFSIDFSEKIYAGLWFAPEMKALKAFFEAIQAYVTGDVILGLYKGNIFINSLTSDFSLFNTEKSSFENDIGITGTDASGLINIKSNELKTYYSICREGKEN